MCFLHNNERVGIDFRYQFGKKSKLLPLHSSQEEVETHRDHSIFAYNLAPDYDFKQDILSFGDSIEVLEPKRLRESISEVVKSMSKKYQ